MAYLATTAAAKATPRQVATGAYVCIDSHEIISRRLHKEKRILDPCAVFTLPLFFEVALQDGSTDSVIQEDGLESTRILEKPTNGVLPECRRLRLWERKW
jgi:hypothetical protein